MSPDVCEQASIMAEERSEIVMPAFGVGTADASGTLEIVTACCKSLANVLYPSEAIQAVGGRVLLGVLVAEVGKVAVEDGMQLVAVSAARHIPCPRSRRYGNRGAHIHWYGTDCLVASRGRRIHESPHNMAHSPDAFSLLRSCDGAGDAHRYLHYGLIVLKYSSMRSNSHAQT